MFLSVPVGRSGDSCPQLCSIANVLYVNKVGCEARSEGLLHLVSEILGSCCASSCMKAAAHDGAYCLLLEVRYLTWPY